MLLPRMGRREGREGLFPFDSPSASYYYFARNALWEAIKLLDLAGGEVVVPAYHHGVEIETLLAAGVKPVFYPVGRKWDVNLADVEALIGPGTRALYIIHYAGFPGPAGQMRALADHYNLPLIEDCALSLLSSDGNSPLGSTGDVAFYSIYKMLPVPNGGLMVLNGDMAKRAAEVAPTVVPPFTSTLSHILSSLLQNVESRGGRAGRLVRQGVRRLGRRTVEKAGIERVTTGSDHFNPGDVGLGMSGSSHNVLAAQDMRRIVEVRRRNYHYLLRQLRDVAPPLMPRLGDGVCPLFYPMIVRDKELIGRKLEAVGIEAIDFWHYFHPSCDPKQFPDAAWLREHVLEVPCHQDLTPKRMSYVAAMVREVVCREQPN
ncbi:MAG: DegT/DnrJ/EryC1/StrS family aminotransferase, partial [Chloroflexota bacterium]|nr:DegT/DnrJ/EryC1/StrS family aminotransferase [Chloroflexota bacterium]